MAKRYILLFLLLAGLLPAQVLLPTHQSAFELEHNFNPELIKQKGIRRITYEIMDKKDFEVAVDKHLVETYEFNSEGLVSRYYYTNVAKTFERHSPVYNRGKAVSYNVTYEYVYDTVSTSYFYNNRNQLILRRFHDGANYYESRYYHYNAEGLLTKELRYKETNNSPGKGVFILGNQVLLSEDSFQYHKAGKGIQKCVFVNNENRPYKERITRSDSTGLVIAMNETYLAATWIRQEHSYEYRGKRLVAARFEGNANNNIVLKHVYEYDENNELYSEKQFRNELLLKEISYVTDKQNGLLNSIIIRDPTNKNMRIIRLKYDFGMIGKAGG